jgi:putative heme-binding domain-containing protein
MAGAIAAPPALVTELKLPPGFTARLYADNPLAPDVYTMTIDDAGRVLVAGRGYVRVLIDDDNDGYADRAIELIDGLKDGPMGLLVEGDSLFVVGDGGLKRYRGYNGKDKLKGPPETIVALKASGEHDAHAVRRGPDGWLYLLCGNSAGVRKEIITGDRSPVKDPIAGALLRIAPDFKSVEVVADGFRNPYSFDFNPDGEPFTYDSDNERCVGLPWYEGCRFYHVVPGGNHGWRSPQLSQTWRKPPYFPDVVPPVCDTGRGSPTGVVCYRHTHFPEAYRGGFFLADWTFGRIYHVPLKPAGASYSGKHEIFLEATGTSGFAPTALAVHPKTGELFVSIGGRGTRGGVYRITCDKGAAEPKPIAMAKRSLEFDKDRAKQWLADCLSDDAQKRRIALELIARWWDKADWGRKLGAAVQPNLSHADRFVRLAAGRVGKNWYVDLGPVTDVRARLTLALAQAGDDPKWALKVALAAIEDEATPPAELVRAFRVVHLAYGDLTAKDAIGTVREGYTFRSPVPPDEHQRIDKVLTGVSLRSKNDAKWREANLELARVLAATGADELLARQVTLSRMYGTWQRPAPDGSYADDFHYLAALSNMKGPGSTRNGKDVAAALLEVLAKVKRRNILIDRHWPIRLTEVVGRLARNYGDFSVRVVEHPDFGSPEHALFAPALLSSSREGEKSVLAEQIAEKFLAAAEKDKNYAWTPAVVELLSALPPEKVQKLLRALWDRPGLEDAIIRVLAVQPSATDLPKFVVGLKSLDPELVRISAHAVAQLPPGAKTEVYVQSVKALRRFPDDKANAAARAELVALLQKYSGQKTGADVKAWTAWVIKNDPLTEKLLNATDGFDAAAWEKRLAGIDWSKGDAERGRIAFTKATCAACHDGGRAVGPSLLGISKRFGRADLLTAILQPSKDVSPRYRPTRVVTTDDKAYTGIIIYEATDGVILQTGADSTVRIAGANIASSKQVEVSLMPTGLIDKLTGAEIADLLAYLATLGEPKPK